MGSSQAAGDRALLILARMGTLSTNSVLTPSTHRASQRGLDRGLIRQVISAQLATGMFTRIVGAWISQVQVDQATPSDIVELVSLEQQLLERQLERKARRELF